MKPALVAALTLVLSAAAAPAFAQAEPQPAPILADRVLANKARIDALKEGARLEGRKLTRNEALEVADLERRLKLLELAQVSQVTSRFAPSEGQRASWRSEQLRYLFPRRNDIDLSAPIL